MIPRIAVDVGTVALFVVVATAAAVTGFSNVAAAFGALAVLTAGVVVYQAVRR
jgi:hypothetical protein